MDIFHNYQPFFKKNTKFLIITGGITLDHSPGTCQNLIAKGINGKRMIHTCINNNDAHINIDYFPHGLYTVQLHDEKISYSHLILKQQ